MAFTTLVLADDLHRRSLKLGPGRDAAVNALAHELAVVAIASLLMACGNPAILSVMDKNYFREQFDLGERVFGTWLGQGDQAAPSPEPLARVFTIERLLAVCAFMWQQLGLEEMSICAHLRRFQFDYVTGQLMAGRLRDGKELMDVSGAAGSASGNTRVLANIIDASCHSDCGEISAAYVRDAADVVRKIGGSRRLLREMSLLTIYHGHSYGGELSTYLEDLLGGEEENGGYVEELLGKLSSDDVNSFVLDLLNCTFRLSDEQLVDKVEHVIAQFVELLPAGALHEQQAARLDYARLQWLAKSGKPLPPVEQILDQWKGRKDSRSYVMVLKLLVCDGKITDQVRADAYAVLENKNAPDTGNFLLALALAPSTKDDIAIGRIVTVLAQEIRDFEARLSAESNLDALRLLIKHVDRPDLRTMWNKWEKYRIERDHQLWLREYLVPGRYTFLVNEYCNWATYWGLDLDVSPENWSTLRDSDNDMRARILKEWRDSKNNVPNPIVVFGGEPCISSKFRSLTTFLFSPPFDDDHAWDRERERFNEAARVAWPDLTRTIRQLKRIPPNIRESLEYHDQVLLQYDGQAVRNGRLLSRDLSFVSTP